MTNQQQNWNKIISDLEHTIDGIGGEMDPGIIETVAGLVALGFNTTASCEGHLDHGTAGPWIDIESPIDTTGIRTSAIETIEKAQQTDSDELFAQAHLLFKKADQPHLEERKKLMNLLMEFYKNRSVAHNVILNIQTWGGGSTRLENHGQSLQDIASNEERQQNLTNYQNEMKKFGEFLKSRYFAQTS